MNLVIYNRDNTKADKLNESVYLRAAVVYSNNLTICCYVSSNLLLWKQRDNLSDKDFCEWLIHLVPELGKETEGLPEMMKLINKIRKIKHKTKNELIIIQKVELILKSMKGILLNTWSRNLDLYKLFPIYELIENAKEIYSKPEYIIGYKTDKIKILCNPDYDLDVDNDDIFVKMIIDCIIDNDECFIFDEVIESFVSITKIETEQFADDTYFISAPLFEFPLLCDLNGEHLKNIIAEISPAMNIFYDEFKKLKAELSKVTYAKNINQIQFELNTFIINNIQNIQLKIDNNIYIQKQKNKYSKDTKITAMIGITSIENCVRLFEKEEVILPFVADSIIEKLNKTIDINSCIPFIYHKLPKIDRPLQN